MGEVAGRAEDDEHGRDGRAAGAEADAQRVGLGVADDLGHGYPLPTDSASSSSGVITATGRLRLRRAWRSPMA